MLKVEAQHACEEERPLRSTQLPGFRDLGGGGGGEAFKVSGGHRGFAAVAPNFGGPGCNIGAIKN